MPSSVLRCQEICSLLNLPEYLWIKPVNKQVQTGADKSCLTYFLLIGIYNSYVLVKKILVMVYMTSYSCLTNMATNVLPLTLRVNEAKGDMNCILKIMSEIILFCLAHFFLFVIQFISLSTIS